MCPVCIATAAMIAGSATGTGGLTAFVSRRIFRRRTAAGSSGGKKEKQYGDRNSRNNALENSAARGVDCGTQGISR